MFTLKRVVETASSCISWFIVLLFQGALTHGDRRATESRDLSRFNIDNRYGRAALEAVMKSVLTGEPGFVDPPKSYKGNFFQGLFLSSTILTHCTVLIFKAVNFAK